MAPSLNSNDTTNTYTSTSTIKFLYSYAGKILPRRIDGKLRYVGGFTRVLAVDRSITFAELMVKFGESCGSSMSLRCKLPSDDLDLLISVTCDEDLATVIEEYDQVSSSSHQDMKIRAILFPMKSLKKISPLPSAVSSVNFPASKSQPYAVAGLYSEHPLNMPMEAYRYGCMRSSPTVGFPINVQKDAVKVRYYPCREQERPRHSYLVPHWNHWQ